jgi:anti-sigma B factor antagonist
MAEMATRVIPDCPSLLLDLSGVEWVSSAGVGALVRLLTRTQSSGGTMAIYGCGPRVRTVLRICGLEKALNVCETGVEARARLDPTRG